MHGLVGTILGVVVASGAADPDPAWSRVRSAHFEVLTDAGSSLALQAAERLEQLRIVLRVPFPPRGEGERRVVVLLLASSARFEALVPRRHRQARHVDGFFQGGGEWDTIVARISLGERGPYSALDHEHAHLVLNRSLAAQPVWVAEGLAELLSDARLEEQEARLGAEQPIHAARARGSSEPLADLVRLGHDSPEYLGGGVGDGLYSRSWALVRFVLARHGLPGLQAFLDAVAEGREPTLAFEERFGPLERAQATLLELAPDPLLRVAREHAGPAPATPFFADSPRPAEVEQRLGALLLESGELARARLHLDRALAAEPGYVPARVSLGQLRLRKGEWNEAGRELERALELAPDDPAALLHDARLRVARAQALGEPLSAEAEERLAARLERVLLLAPDLFEATLLLGELRPRPDPRRLTALEAAFDQDPGRTEVGRALAALHVKLRDLAAAQRVLRRARDAARDPAYRFLCEHLLAQLGGFAAGTLEVRGRLVNLECRPDGSLRFSVATPAGVLWLEAASSRSFLLYGEEAASGERELVCGLQDRPLVVRYRPSESDAAGVQGRVLWMALPGTEERAPIARVRW